MTRAEIDRALDRLIKGGQIPVGYRIEVTAVALLAEIVQQQEQRLRAVEPCPGAPAVHRDKSHVWNDDGKCSRCEARKHAAR